MIPRIIHYCWFGQHEKPEYFKECLITWQQYFAGYTFMEWNESNVALEHPFLQNAYQRKQWAFVADFVRIQKLKEHGGIYLDTDMYFIKSIPEYYLKHAAFLGAENKHSLSAGIIGSVPHGAFINSVFDAYTKLEFENLTDILIPKVLNRACPDVTRPIVNDQVLNWGLVLEPSVFYPLPLKLKKYHWRKFLTDRTLAVHLWAGSWLEEKNLSIPERVKSKFKYVLSKWYVPQSFLDYARSQ